MTKEMEALIDKYYDDDNHEEIVNLILNVPEAERDIDMLGQLVVAYNNLDRYDDAIALSMELKEKSAKNISWYYRLAYAYMGKEDYETAMKNIEIAMDLAKDTDDPEWPKILQELYDECALYLSSSKERRDSEFVNYNKEWSYMVVIPQNEESINELGDILTRLSESENMKLLSHDFDKVLELKLEIDGTEYHVNVLPTDFEIPEMFRINHFFPDLDVDAISKSSVGLGVEMEFSENSLESYHAQLKIIHTLVPDVLAVLDFSSEKILSGKWVSLAADSKVPPAPRYIYTVQAVSGEEDCVWLHSHGLNRCGLPEIEVLNSDKETYQNHYHVMETLANRMLEMEEPLELGEPILVAQVTDEIPLVATLIDWKEAISHYPKDMLGGEADREEGHNEYTCGIFVYPTYEDLEKGEYAPLAVFDELLQDNPMYMISDAETGRMRNLARERISYVLKAAKNPDDMIMLKIGLKTDEEFQEDMEYEHIWFELMEASEDTVTCKLTQEPYYVKDLHEGSVGTYSFDQITDWLIFTKERRITADDVYLYEYIETFFEEVADEED